MYKRIIVKIGTAVITRAGRLPAGRQGALDPRVLERLVEDVSRLRRGGIEVIVVTSGAVGTGRGIITPKNGSGTVVSKQVLAAVGQIKLMSLYASHFARRGITCAQVLATKEDFRDREHRLNMTNCLESLLRNDVVPIVNENDVVAVEELMFTDNDELAGLLATLLKADAVVLLTSVGGVIAGDHRDKKAEVIREIDYARIAVYRKYVKPDTSAFGRGGMLTKFGVARKLAARGIATHIANGKERGVLAGILAGKPIGTKFLPKGTL